MGLLMVILSMLATLSNKDESNESQGGGSISIVYYHEMYSWVQHDNLSRKTQDKAKDSGRKKKKKGFVEKRMLKDHFTNQQLVYIWEVENAFSLFRIADFKELNTHNFCSAIPVQNFSSSLIEFKIVARLGFSCQSVTHSALFDMASFRAWKVCRWRPQQKQSNYAWHCAA
jgi:hypothetical protein